jgi:acetyltransferase-like isoleucine patch superfamily enzyme
MRKWFFDHYKKHIQPYFVKWLFLISRKRVETKINGRQNKSNFKFTSKKSCLFIKGCHNKININSAANIKSLKIDIKGNGNNLEFEDNVLIENLSIYCEGDDCRFCISGGSYISAAVFILAESGTSIKIGKNCMFAGGIEVRTGDSHGIFDVSSRARINHGKDVVIGDYVWIANGATILKGSNIPHGSIIGSKSIVSGALDFENAIYAGAPAKSVKQNVAWSWDLNRFPEHRFNDI